MDIPEFYEYHPPRLSGCSQKYANLYGPKRIYKHGAEYELELFSIASLFDFVWKYKIAGKKKKTIIRNMSFGCPLQFIAINEEIDFDSFTSLN